MCGIIGVVKNEPVLLDIYNGLLTLQHRGQDAAGIITYDNKFNLKKGIGLARDVFHPGNVEKLRGNSGLGHVRYITAGGNCQEESQPFITDSPYGIALVHNGNLTNYEELKKEVQSTNLRHLNTNSDSELLLSVLADELLKQKKPNLSPKNIFDAVSNVFKRVKGSYSVIAYIADHGMIAFRDPVGIRPLKIGQRRKDLKDEYIIASEDVTMNSLGFKETKDIKNGEVIYIDKHHKLHSKVCAHQVQKTCIFEYVYLARPDSMLDNVSVYKSRIRMGERVAKQVVDKNWDIDVVMPVPDSARSTALAIATTLGIPYREGIVKNRYIGRTFIMPGQNVRKKSIRFKLNTIELEIKDKNILLVEDSIVRGNTSKKIIELLRESGAKKVYFVSAAPALRHPCVYGIDMPTRQEFVATGLKTDEIEKVIGADGLIYQELDDLIEACQSEKGAGMQFCTACFDGKYPTKEVTKEKLDELEKNRTQALSDENNNDSQLTLV